jgi:hypothetical protein
MASESSVPDTVKLKIQSRSSFAEGHAFGQVGAYELIKARAMLALDPDAPAQAGVYDIQLAPLDPDGLVRVATDVWILKPSDQTKGNGAVLVEFPNRGNKRCLQFFNDAPGTNVPSSLADAGNGYLMRQGYTVVVVAWQGDVLPGDNRLTIELPVARENGRDVEHLIRAEFISDVPGVTSLALSGKNGTRSHPTVSLDTTRAELRRRRYPWSTPQPIPPNEWHFARVEGGGRGQGDMAGGEQAIVASDQHIYLPSGFETGWIYELIYTARDPLVLDLGFAAFREVISFLRNSDTADNPLAGSGRPMRFYGWGRSQSGRLIRDFIHRGFNDDGAGGKVFDGMIAHVAGAGRTAMNRFSNLVIAASRQYEDWLNPADRFPFSYAVSKDHITGAEDGILKRPETDPLVIHTQTASEYWYRRGSLVHTDTQGNDLTQPENARIYFWSSSQHWADPASGRPARGICSNYQNVVATSAFFRSTLALMDTWVKDGVAPPPSEHPRRSDGTLVDMETWRTQFPAIPGVATPARPNTLPFIDYGPGFAEGAPVAEPPAVDESRCYEVLVPAVDVDGNDVAGLRAPMVSAALGTYTGWNLRVAGYGAGALHDFSGSYIPFAESVDERELARDPRPAILERFSSRDAYADAIEAAAEELVQRRFLLQEDVRRAKAGAAEWGGARHVIHLKGDE